MANTRIRDNWEPMVKQVIADLGPRAGPTPILRELKRRVEDLRKRGEQISTDYPSPRTIQRTKKDFTPEELSEYERFYWPESLERGALPWEAGPAALELMAFYDMEAITRGFRPPIHIVRWFWRVTQVAPNASVHDRVDIALDLAYYRSTGWTDMSRVDEWRLAYYQVPEKREDGSPLREEAYRRAKNRMDKQLPYAERRRIMPPGGGHSIFFMVGQGVSSLSPTEIVEKEDTDGEAQA